MTHSPCRVLIIDDESSIRTNLVRYLEDYEDYELLVADSGEAALALLQQSPAHLCVVDMRLPGMTGQQFIIAAADRNLCTRFIIHTGSLGVSLTEELRDLHMEDADLFFKPCDITQLHQRIQYHLDALDRK